MDDESHAAMLDAALKDELTTANILNLFCDHRSIYTHSQMAMNVASCPIPRLTLKNDHPFVNSPFMLVIPAEAFMMNAGSIGDFRMNTAVGTCYKHLLSFMLAAIGVENIGSPSNWCVQLNPEEAKEVTIGEFASGEYLRSTLNGSRQMKKYNDAVIVAARTGGALPPAPVYPPSNLVYGWTHLTLERKQRNKFRLFYYVCVKTMTNTSADFNDMTALVVVIVPTDQTFSFVDAVNAMLVENRKQVAPHMFEKRVRRAMEDSKKRFADRGHTDIDVDPSEIRPADMPHRYIINSAHGLLELLYSTGHLKRDLYDEFMEEVASDIYVKVSIDMLDCFLSPTFVKDRLADLGTCEQQLVSLIPDNPVTGELEVQFACPTYAFEFKSNDFFSFKNQCRMLLPWLPLRFSRPSTASLHRPPLETVIAGLKTTLRDVLNSHVPGLVSSSPVVERQVIKKDVFERLRALCRGYYMQRSNLLKNRDVVPITAEQMSYIKQTDDLIIKLYIHFCDVNSDVPNAMKAMFEYYENNFVITPQPIVAMQHYVASNLDVFGSCMVGQLMKLDSLGLVYSAHLPILAAFQSACSAWAPFLDMAMHMLLVGDPGTSKSVILTFLYAFLVPKTAVKETGSSAMSEFIDVFERSLDVALADEIPEFMLDPSTDKRRLPMWLNKVTERAISYAVVSHVRKDERSRSRMENTAYAGDWFGVFIGTTNERSIMQNVLSRMVTYYSERSVVPANREFFDYASYNKDAVDRMAFDSKLKPFYNRIHFLVAMACRMISIGILPPVDMSLYTICAQRYAATLKVLGIMITNTRFGKHTSASFVMQTIMHAVYLCFFSEFCPFRIGMKKEADNSYSLEFENFCMEHLLKIGPYMAPNLELTVWSLTHSHSNAIATLDEKLLAAVSRQCCRLDVPMIRQLVAAFDHNAVYFGRSHLTAPAPTTMPRTNNHTRANQPPANPPEQPPVNANPIATTRWCDTANEGDVYNVYIGDGRKIARPDRSVIYAAPNQNNYANYDAFKLDTISWKETIVPVGTEHLFVGEGKAPLNTADDPTFQGPIICDPSYSETALSFLLNYDVTTGLYELDPNYVVVAVAVNANKVIHDVTAALRSRFQKSHVSVKDFINTCNNTNVEAPLLPKIQVDIGEPFSAARFAALLHPKQLHAVPRASQKVMDFLPGHGIFVNHKQCTNNTVLVMLAHTIFQNAGSWVSECVQSVSDANTRPCTLTVPMCVEGMPNLMQQVSIGPRVTQTRVVDIHACSSAQYSVVHDAFGKPTPAKRRQVQIAPKVDIEVHAIAEFNKRHAFDLYGEHELNYRFNQQRRLHILYGIEAPTAESIAFLRLDPVFANITERELDVWSSTIGERIKQRGSYPRDFIWHPPKPQNDAPSSQPRDTPADRASQTPQEESAEEEAEEEEQEDQQPPEEEEEEEPLQRRYAPAASSVESRKRSASTAGLQQNAAAHRSAHTAGGSSTSVLNARYGVIGL